MPRKESVTHAWVRNTALSLPETEESSHHGTADIRVRGKIFVTLPADGKTVNLKTTPVDLDAMVSSDPDTFRNAWGNRWAGVDLELIEADQLRQLIVDAWKLAAPKRLANSLEMDSS